MQSYILPISGYSLPTILHGVGIILLYKAKGVELPNQRIITLNLSIAEFFYCLSRVVQYTTLLAQVSTPLIYALLYCFSGILLCAIRFAVLHIIIDRFLDIWLNIRYSVYITKKTLVKAIIFQWVLGLLLAAALVSLLTFKLISQDKAKFVRLSVDIIIIIAALSTFTYIFAKVKRAIYGHTLNRKRNRSPRVWFKLKIPLLMVSTFIAFNTTSSILWCHRDDSDEAKYYSYALVLDLFGWCTDAFIYVFLQKRVRSLLVSCCSRTHREQVGNTRTSRISQSIYNTQA